MSLSTVKSKVSVLLLICSLFMLVPTMVSATTDLNGIGVQQPTQAVQPQTTPNTPTDTTPTEGGTAAEALGSLYENIGPDAEATAKANKVMQPVVYWANIGFAILLAFAFVAMFFITGLDLVYIAVPPVRRFLLPEQQQQGGGMGGMGGGFGGGFGGGMGGGFGGGMGGGQPQQSSGMGQWISDEAKAAVTESQPQQQGGGMGMGGFGGGMGGFGGGMGGFGGGMGGGAEQPKAKTVILSYFKKRVIFLVLFGLCALLLSTTLFTDIGINIGTWIMNRLLGINESIPE